MVRNTLHGTAIAIFQKCHDNDLPLDVKLTSPAKDRSLKNLPRNVLLECPKPVSQPQYSTYPKFSATVQHSETVKASLPDITWMLGRTIEVKTEEQDVTLYENNLPPWAGYHSLLNDKLPATRVGAPPLIPAPAHEWSTLLTVLKQAQSINVQVVGPQRKTVISLDMGLYKPAKQLQIARDDLNNLILRPGELHFVMAQLRTIGSYIENSGVDLMWTEGDLYEPAMVKQIILWGTCKLRGYCPPHHIAGPFSIV